MMDFQVAQLPLEQLSSNRELARNTSFCEGLPDSRFALSGPAFISYRAS
jgi:hypothetical protein